MRHKCVRTYTIFHCLEIVFFFVISLLLLYYYFFFPPLSGYKLYQCPRENIAQTTVTSCETTTDEGDKIPDDDVFIRIRSSRVRRQKHYYFYDLQTKLQY